MSYDLIVADPPWRYDFAHTRHAGVKYETMTVEELAALKPEANEKCSMLLLWACGPKIPEAIELMQRWGFEYKGVLFVWLKVSKFDENHIVMGLGHYTRSNCEFVLFGTRGKGHKKWKKTSSINQIIKAPHREHSRKPEEFWTALAELFDLSDKKCLEMFSREKHLHFDQHGDQPDFFSVSPESGVLLG